MAPTPELGWHGRRAWLLAYKRCQLLRSPPLAGMLACFSSGQCAALSCMGKNPTHIQKQETPIWSLDNKNETEISNTNSSFRSQWFKIIWAIDLQLQGLTDPKRTLRKDRVKLMNRRSNQKYPKIVKKEKCWGWNKRHQFDLWITPWGTITSHSWAQQSKGGKKIRSKIHSLSNPALKTNERISKWETTKRSLGEWPKCSYMKHTT